MQCTVSRAAHHGHAPASPARNCLPCLHAKVNRNPEYAGINATFCSAACLQKAPWHAAAEGRHQGCDCLKITQMFWHLMGAVGR